MAITGLPSCWFIASRKMRIPVVRCCASSTGLPQRRSGRERAGLHPHADRRGGPVEKTWEKDLKDSGARSSGRPISQRGSRHPERRRELTRHGEAEKESESPDAPGPSSVGVRSRSLGDRFFRGLTGFFAALGVVVRLRHAGHAPRGFVAGAEAFGLSSGQQGMEPGHWTVLGHWPALTVRYHFAGSRCSWVYRSASASVW